jgi:hypothetical protein
MYIPKGAVSLKDFKMQQIRLGIQGPSGTGKTWAAATFPNCVFVNFDRGLGAHIGREDLLEIPFWEDEFVDKIVPKTPGSRSSNRKDAILKWLSTEARKLEADQTLVVDGGTGLQNAFHIQYALEPVYTKTGKIDDFAEWRFKVEFFGELCDMLKSLKCHVVYISHETLDRGKDGELNGKVRPLITGQFGDQLASHFTDC